MRSQLFRLFAILLGIMILASPKASQAQVTDSLLSAGQNKSIGVTSHLNSGPIPKQVSAQNVELLGHFGGVTEAVFVQDKIAYIGEGSQLTLVNVSVPSSPTFLGKTEPLNGIVREILVLNNIAYVITTNNYSTEAEGGLYLVDTSNPTAPNILSSIQFSKFYLYSGSIFVQGNLAYISTYENIKIIDISNHLLPVEVGTLPYTGSIIVKGSIAYVASNNHFAILDISNPDQIITLADLANMQLYYMSLVNNYVIAVSFDGINRGFVIIDVSNPEQPLIMTSLKWASVGNPPRFFVNGETLFLVEQNLSYTPAKLRIFDISNPSQVTEINTTVSLPEEISTGSGRVDIFITNNIAYISSSSGGLAIINIADPAHPIVQGFYDLTVGNFQNYFVEGNVLYVPETGRGLRTIDVSNPAHVAKLGFYDSPGEALKVFVNNGIAYLADGSHELRIINAADPTNLTEAGSYDQQLYLSDVFVEKGIAFAIASVSSTGSNCNTLVSYDVSRIDQTKFLGEIGHCNSNSILKVENNLAYISTFYGLELFDVSNPITPTQITAYYAGNYPSGYVKDGRAYLIPTSGELQVVDVSSPNNLHKLGSFVSADRPLDVAVEANIAYVAVAGRGISLIDVSDPSNMTEIGFYRAIVGGWKISVKNGVIYLADNVGGFYMLQYTPSNVATYNITGRITNENGIGISNVAIQGMGGNSFKTDESGYYTITNLIASTYVITPVLAGKTFSPATQTVSVPPSKNNINFIANQDQPKQVVIFIPGMAGSNLLRTSDKKYLWPVWSDDTKMQLSLKPGGTHPEVYTDDAFRKYAIPAWPDYQVYGPFLEAMTNTQHYVEYQTEGDPQKRREGKGNCDTAQKNATLFVFPWDWRYGIADGVNPQIALAPNNVELLHEFINCILQIYAGKDVQITVVAHSMGGMLITEYLLTHPTGHHIKQVITVGTPYLGAPKAIASLLAGDFTPLISPSTTKSLLEYFPGGHQLLPSKKYFEMAEGDPFVVYEDLHIGGEGYFPVPYENFQQALQSYYRSPSEGDSYRTQVNFVGNNEAVFGNPAFTSWTKNTFGVEYNIIYAESQEAETIGQVKEKVLLFTEPGGIAHRTGAYDFNYTLGDGTVPIVSASRISNGQNLNGGARLYRFKQQKGLIFNESNLEHIDLLDNERIRSCVFYILGNSTTPCANDPISEVSASNIQQLHDVAPARYTNLWGVTSLKITNGIGTTDNLITSTISLESLFPDVRLYYLGDKAVSIIMPQNGSYTVTFTSDDHLQVEATVGTGVTVNHVIRYTDVPVKLGTHLALVSTTEQLAQISIDANDDGSPESPVQPSGDLSGNQLNDTTPPTITIGYDNATKIATINAMDDRSGVSRVFYSVDGVEYQLYTQPFVVDASVISLFAQAEDKAGNISQVVNQKLQTNTGIFLPLITR